MIKRSNDFTFLGFSASCAIHNKPTDQPSIPAEIYFYILCGDLYLSLAYEAKRLFLVDHSDHKVRVSVPLSLAIRSRYLFAFVFLSSPLNVVHIEEESNKAINRKDTHTANEHCRSIRLNKWHVIFVKELFICVAFEREKLSHSPAHSIHAIPRSPSTNHNRKHNTHLIYKLFLL